MAKKIEMVASESDDRTANNGVRHQYRVLSELDKANMIAVKNRAAELIQFIDSLAPSRSRDMQLAIEHTEDAAMRAVRHITA